MADTDAIECARSGCDKPARCAIKTIRSTKDRSVKSTIHYDERVAPISAEFLCKEHGIETITVLAKTLIDEG